MYTNLTPALIFVRILSRKKGRSPWHCPRCRRTEALLSLSKLDARCPLCMTPIFSNTIRWAIRIFSSFSKEDSSVGISHTYILFTTAWHGNFPFMTFEWHVLHIHCFPSNDCWLNTEICLTWVLLVYACYYRFRIKYSITDSTYEIRALSHFPLKLVNTQFNRFGFH